MGRERKGEKTWLEDGQNGQKWAKPRPRPRKKRAKKAPFPSLSEPRATPPPSHAKMMKTAKKLAKPVVYFILGGPGAGKGSLNAAVILSPSLKTWQLDPCRKEPFLPNQPNTSLSNETKTETESEPTSFPPPPLPPPFASRHSVSHASCAPQLSASFCR